MDIIPGTIYLSAWVQVGSVIYQAEIVDADGGTHIARVIRLGTLVEQSVPFAALSSVALMQGHTVLQAFGRPAAQRTPEWVRYAEVSP